MKKYFYSLIACLCLVIGQAQQRAGGVIEYPLTSTDGTAPKGVNSNGQQNSVNVPQGKKRYTPEGIVLTTSKVSYSGFIIDDLTIDLREGVTIEFDYAMAYTAPPNSAGTGQGIGMTFFVFDAKETFKLGFGQDALGYAYNEATGAEGRRLGLAGGYLGIGFDYGGNFKNFLNVNMQYREGISPQRFKDAGLSVTSFSAYNSNHITLRGATNDSKTGGGFRGNPVLITKYFGSNSKVAQNAISMATLDFKTGQYKFGRNDSYADFIVGEGGKEDAPTFQRIRVELNPASDGNAMLVTVKALVGAKELMLIDQFRYETSLKAFDKLNNLYDLDATIPQKVKIGFSASTGNNSLQKTIIRNLKVSSQSSLAIATIEADMCVSSLGNSDKVTKEVTLFKDIDFSVNANSFSFLDDKNKEVGMTYTQANVGKWTYSAKDKAATLVLSNKDFKPGDVAEVGYVVSSQEGIKSEAAAIKILGIACGVLTNPQLRLRNEKPLP